jgi:CheY-like chemotaxis protein
MAGEQSGGQAKERRRVLIVEDEPGLAEVVTEILRDEGYDVTATDSAIGAGALVRSVAPHAILLDLGLPYRSGASLLAELKADPRTAHIPVLVVTGAPEVLAGGRRGLAAAVLPKPFGAQTLLDALRGALHAS